ncbi:hypothetical protein XENTR_v10010590 [Xenopus tropicalis]|nr:hypothetical protein XENTR_v10010590 [Xenopus tropicalis]
MDCRYRRMEDSLKRSAELGRDLLERMRSREVGWACSGGLQEAELTEAVDDGANLEEAFAVMADFMRRTTEQCAVTSILFLFLPKTLKPVSGYRPHRVSRGGWGGNCLYIMYHCDFT